MRHLKYDDSRNESLKPKFMSFLAIYFTLYACVWSRMWCYITSLKIEMRFTCAFVLRTLF